MTDHYDELTGDDLDADFKAANGPTSGGANQDGTLNADQKREWLRANTDTYESSAERDDNPHNLSDNERADAQAGPVDRLYSDALNRAHAAADTDEIARLTADINDHREARHAAKLRG